MSENGNSRTPGKNMNPGDEAPPGTPSSGEDMCPTCNGTGKAEGETCPTCQGEGRINEGIGGG